MRFFLVIAIIVILIGLFFISLTNLADYGVSSLILAAISTAALYRIFKYLLEGDRTTDGNSENTADGGVQPPSPVDYLIFGDIAREKPDDWTK